ncbi:hypothetical protein O6H91_04G068200 [Diphasiastrum complanatum]|uniref:Uncharacterized protein n=1 Tax=Diphasiastrum complanatum TaxID=34168 RepID=A0ACC2DXP8_DIPCM|nr:hypothetical protein O6H91_04G068200 [Diphasiastrum complanatum]
METASFITSLATSFSIFCVLLIVYEFLSRQPRNYPVYYAAVRLSTGSDPPEPRRPFTWIREAWEASETDIIKLAGLDGAVYLSLFETSLKILGCTAIFCLPVLIPLSATSHNYNTLNTSSSSTNGSTVNGSHKFSALGNLTVIRGPSFGGFDRFAMGNISDHDRNRIWAFLVGSYWLSVVTYVILWKKYKHIMTLRSTLLSSTKAQPEDFTVLVHDIPYDKTMTHAQQVDTFFKKLYGESYERCLVVMKLKKTSKFWKELEKFKEKLTLSEARFLSSKTKAKPEGIRPQHRTQFFGLFGSKVDSIDYFREKIKDLVARLEAEQSRVRIKEQEGAAFVFFNNRITAAAAAQAMHAPSGRTWRTMPAPQPKDVVWENVLIPFYERLIRQAVVYLIVFLTVLFYMIPVAFISAVTSWNNLEIAFPFMKTIGKVGPLHAILQAYLPQLALSGFLALLPTFLKFLSKLEGLFSKSHLIRATAGKYFYFVIFNVFLGVTLGTTLFNSLKRLKGNLSFDSVVQLLGSSLPPAASFFITYISLKLFVGYGLELSRIFPLLFYHSKKKFMRKFMNKPEQELKEASNPGPFKYHRNVPNDMLVLTIALCYAVIAPMVLPFAMLYFGIGWLVLRNQALKVYVPSYDSKGCLWPHIHVRILVALLVSQLTMLGYFTIKRFVYTFLLLPLPIATLMFGYLCQNIFYHPFKVTPLETASREVKEMPSIQEIVRDYTPTCLLEEDNIHDDVEKSETEK